MVEGKGEGELVLAPHKFEYHFGWKFSFCTSRKQGKSYEVNRLLVYGMRTIGKGYAGARKFCAIMNMPSPPTEKAFIFNSRIIGRHVKIIQKRV